MSQDCKAKQCDHDDEYACQCLEKPKMESPFRHSSHLKMSPRIFRTPIQVKRLEEILEEEVVNENVDSKSQTAQFVLLPSHSTPPQQEKKIQNPFDAALIKRLHLPVVSPSIFKRVVSPTQESCDFSWTIDDVAKLCPAPIEESVPEHYEYTDPELELKAQEAINLYFHNMPMVVPSPWGPSGMCIKSKFRNSPSSDGINNEKEDSNKEATVDTISPEKKLSSERDSKLAVFSVQDTDDSTEEANLSTSTLRRKLFSQEQEETEDVLPLRLSCFPVQLECTESSPLRSGILFNSSKVVCPTTPIDKEQRFGTPITKCKQILDSPEVSPIRSLVCNSLMDTNRMKSSNPYSSPLGASPLNCYEGAVSMVQQWEGEDRSMASLHASYSAMITSETSTPTKRPSIDKLFSVEKIDFEYINENAEKSSEDSDEDVNLTNHINKGTCSAFSSTPIKKVPQDGLLSMENVELSHFKNPLKKESEDQSDVDMSSLNSQDTGYQTGYINSGAVSSAFTSLNNWSSIHQSQALLTNENYEKLLYSISKTTTSVEENSLWKPGCKYIISSTPTKASSY